VNPPGQVSELLPKGWWGYISVAYHLAGCVTQHCVCVCVGVFCNPARARTRSVRRPAKLLPPPPRAFQANWPPRSPALSGFWVQFFCETELLQRGGGGTVRYSSVARHLAGCVCVCVFYSPARARTRSVRRLAKLLLALPMHSNPKPIGHRPPAAHHPSFRKATGRGASRFSLCLFVLAVRFGSAAPPPLPNGERASLLSVGSVFCETDLHPFAACPPASVTRRHPTTLVAGVKLRADESIRLPLELSGSNYQATASAMYRGKAC
jgi:hypothetical protein